MCSIGSTSSSLSCRYSSSSNSWLKTNKYSPRSNNSCNYSHRTISSSSLHANRYSRHWNNANQLSILNTHNTNSYSPCTTNSYNRPRSIKSRGKHTTAGSTSYKQTSYHTRIQSRPSTKPLPWPLRSIRSIYKHHNKRSNT